MEEEELTVQIDGTEVRVRQGTTILEAANKAGIKIPTLCHHPMIEPPASCRVCVVEMRRGRRVRIVTACNFPIRDDKIEVATRSERVLRARRMTVEFLLARCPEVKVVRDLADELGIEDTPYPKEEENCVLCGRCVAVCSEVIGAEAIGFVGRGIFLKVGTPFGAEADACIGCGACTYVCPTGAIQMEAETIQRWRRELSGDERICRYARMGLIPYKVCPNNFECFRCEVDQRMEETFGMHPALALRPAGAKQAEKVGEFVLRPDVLYHQGHVWVRPLNGKVMLGLDDFAQRLFGNVHDISLSPSGGKVNRGDVAWTVDCEGKHAKMLFPFGGRIADVNRDVITDPSLVQKDPYSRGWIYMMVPSEQDYSAGLLSQNSAKEWLISEAQRLQSVTNGEDPPISLPDEKWNNLVRELFLSGG